MGLTGQSWTVARVGRAMLLLDLALVVVMAIHLGGGWAAGAGRDGRGSGASPDPIAHLGHTFAQIACTSAPLDQRSATLVVCRDFTAITGNDGRARVISLYAPGVTALRAYRGDLPEQLAWGDTITDVVDLLGRPDRITDIWGTPTLVYMFRGRAYGSLELRFNGADRLASINACLSR